MNDELDKPQQLGVIKRIDKPTPGCLPIVTVPKKSTGIRLCVDLTCLNDVVLHEQYILLAIDQMLARMTGAEIFSKLDCNEGFYKIKLSPEYILQLTVTTLYGGF